MGRKVTNFCYITPEMCCTTRKSFPVLGKEMISRGSTEELVIKQCPHALLSKSNVNSTYPLKRLIKVIVGQ